MPYVLRSTTSTAARPMDMKDLLGGKGANLAEMTSVLELPVPPGFTISTDACRAYMARRLAGRARRRDRQARRRLEKKMGGGSATPPIRCSSACAPGPSSRCRG